MCPEGSPLVQFVDFFAGCGGMSYGFHRVASATGNVRNVGAFDNNAHANRTYQQNFEVAPSSVDLEQATVDEIRSIMALNGYERSAPLIAIGCAPCQGFSSHRKKDPRKDGRNSLVGKFAEIAVGLGADLIVMENVPDLLAVKHKNHFNQFYSAVKDAGYRVNVEIVNMAEYGVPQARFRTLVLASRVFTPSLPPKVRLKGEFATVRDAISHLPRLLAGEKSTVDPMHLTSNHRSETVEILKKVPHDGGSRPVGVGPKCLDRVAGFYDVYGRLSWDKPSITITARCRTPSCGRFAHPDQDRGLSVREAALLQGFPPDFDFSGPFDEKFKQIGNAVPPLFSLRLAEHLLGQLNGVAEPLPNEPDAADLNFGSFSGSIAHAGKRK
jgi:DNA (cytosine-5)-methyltransferase 1